MYNIELIVPCYNEEDCVYLFYERICRVFEEQRLKDYDFTITYIDDGSKDKTMDEVKRTVGVHEKSLKLGKAVKGRVQYISLSRNFGKEAALYAGLSKAAGDYVCVLDADLQHPPELIVEMLDAIEKEGYDCASARRVSRHGEPFFRKAFSKLFCSIINKVTAMNLVPGATDYRLMKRKVVEAIVAMPERERFTKGIYSWIGFKNKWIEYKDVERAAGKTTWNFRGLVKYAFSGFMAFATTPLRGVVYLGFAVVVFAVAFAIFTFVSALRSPHAERTGYATILIVVLLLGGIIITILGMIGEYMARIYMEVKNRPIYFARESNIETCPEEPDKKSNKDSEKELSEKGN